jgi:hypothetical protein
LYELIDLVHDQFVDLDSVEFDSKVLKLDLKREDINSLDYRISRRFFFFKRVNYPILLSKLIFRGVSSFRIIDDQEIGIYSINDYSVKDNNLTLNFCEITRLSIDFDDQIEIEITDYKRLNVYGPI